MEYMISIIILAVQLFLFVLFFVCLVSITIHVKRIEALIESKDTIPEKKYFLDKDVGAVLTKNSTKTFVNKNYSNDVNTTKEYSLDKNNEIVVTYYCAAIKASSVDELVKEIKDKIDLSELKGLIKYSLSSNTMNQIRNKYEGETDIDSFIKYRVYRVAKNKNIIIIKDK